MTINPIHSALLSVYVTPKHSEKCVTIICFDEVQAWTFMLTVWVYLYFDMCKYFNGKMFNVWNIDLWRPSTEFHFHVFLFLQPLWILLQ